MGASGRGLPTFRESSRPGFVRWEHFVLRDLDAFVVATFRGFVSLLLQEAAPRALPDVQEYSELAARHPKFHGRSTR